MLKALVLAHAYGPWGSIPLGLLVFYPIWSTYGVELSTGIQPHLVCWCSAPHGLYWCFEDMYLSWSTESHGFKPSLIFYNKVIHTQLNLFTELGKYPDLTRLEASLLLVVWLSKLHSAAQFTPSSGHSPNLWQFKQQTVLHYCLPGS